MVYNNNQRNGGNNQRNGGHGGQQNYRGQQNNTPIVKETRPLTEVLSDFEKVYLPETGLAYKYANDFRGIQNHQMRKILDQVKDALAIEDFEQQKKKMFMIVVMSAYNAGRLGKALKGLYEFTVKYINENTIKTKEDIKEFDQCYTSIVAYHKSISRN